MAILSTTPPSPSPGCWRCASSSPCPLSCTPHPPTRRRQHLKPAHGGATRAVIVTGRGNYGWCCELWYSVPKHAGDEEFVRATTLLLPLAVVRLELFGVAICIGCAVSLVVFCSWAGSLVKLQKGGRSTPAWRCRPLTLPILHRLRRAATGIHCVVPCSAIALSLRWPLDGPADSGINGAGAERACSWARRLLGAPPRCSREASWPNTLPSMLVAPLIHGVHMCPSNGTHQYYMHLMQGMSGQGLYAASSSTCFSTKASISVLQPKLHRPQQPPILLLLASSSLLLYWRWSGDSVFTWDPGLGFFYPRRCLQPHLLTAGVLLQRKLFRPNFNLRFARSSIRVHTSSTPLRPSADGFVFAIAIAAAAIRKQDFIVIWSSFEGLHVKWLL